MSDTTRSALKGNAAFINIGFGNLVAARRVVAVLGASSSPVKRLREDARQKGRLLDATQGRRTRAVLVTEQGQVILSAIAAGTIGARLEAALGGDRSERDAGSP